MGETMQRKVVGVYPEIYWKRPEYPVRLAAGMNGRIMDCAPGGARLANKVFPVPRLIPRRGNPREPLAAGIGRGNFINSAKIPTR